jgi:hypothetical protein
MATAGCIQTCYYNGLKVQVIFPGKTCNDGGCDFQDAVLNINGRMVIGKIEIHVLSSQWYSHKHHLDNRYNDIVLHVVMWHDYPLATLSQNGSAIPTVCLNSHLEGSLNALKQGIKLAYQYIQPCPKMRAFHKVESFINVLNIAGRQRFLGKVASFQSALVREEQGQVLFRNTAGALGYSKNIKPFYKLADNLTIRAIEYTHKVDDIKNQALILGIAGLLPSQRFNSKSDFKEESYTATFEAIWKSAKIGAVMDHSEWCFFRVRPDNFPTRRLIAMSYLIGRYYQSGFLDGMLNLIRGVSCNRRQIRWIEDGLVVSAQGYWANHIDFGSSINRNSALLGRSKAAELAVNILLPFVYSWGALYSEPKLQEKTMKIYGDYPALEDNQLIRYMRQQFSIRPDFRFSSLQQQGLIHIYKTYCYCRDCEACLIAFNRN